MKRSLRERGRGQERERIISEMGRFDIYLDRFRNKGREITREVVRRDQRASSEKENGTRMERGSRERFKREVQEREKGCGEVSFRERVVSRDEVRVRDTQFVLEAPVTDCYSAPGFVGVLDSRSPQESRKSGKYIRNSRRFLYDTIILKPRWSIYSNVSRR